MDQVASYGVVFFVAAVATYAFTFPVRRLALKVGAISYPDERRVHAQPTPTIGGVAMFGAFLLAMGVAWAMPQFRPIFSGSTEPLGIVLAAAIIFAVHVIDDRRGLSAPAKVAGQVRAAMALVNLGVTMVFFHVPLVSTDISISPNLTPLITALWVILIANAINLIDGLDGLAAGVVAIAAVSFFLYGDRLAAAGFLGPDNSGPLVAIIACGVCIGFLPHNFHPARIFMGDSGAMLLGLLLAASTLLMAGRTDDPFGGQTFFFLAPAVIPLVILGVPVFDTVFALVRRARSRSGLATADKAHLHHRLMRLGHGQRRSVLILWAWTAILSGVVLLPIYTQRGHAVIPFFALALGVALYTLFHPGVRRPSPEHVGATSLLDLKAEAEGEPPEHEPAHPKAAENG